LIGLVCYQIGLANHCLPWRHHLPFTDALWTSTGSELIAERA
jgi:predicted acyltransferase